MCKEKSWNVSYGYDFAGLGLKGLNANAIYFAGFDAKAGGKTDQEEQELNLIVDCGGRVKNISISHRVYGRITAEMDIRSRQDVREFLQSFEDSSSTVLSTATDGYHYHLVEAATPDRLSLIEKELKEHGFLAPLQPWEH